MENKFNIGDRVEVLGNSFSGKNLKGKRGRVIGLSGSIAVEFDDCIGGHDCYICGTKGKDGYCWFISSDDLKLIGRVIFNGNATVLIKDGKKYVSKCKDGDAYDKEKGLLLCLAQANGISYRDLQEMIAGAKDCNDKAKVREVKRKAKVGEYIKIVAPKMTFDDYVKGDIFKVVKVCEGGVNREDNKEGECTYIYDSEYVVLENYKPYKITLSEFLKKGAKIAVNLKTDAEYTVFIKACQKRGHFECWEEDEKRKYGVNYCVSRLYGYGYCDKAFYISEGCTIYNFDEVDLEN